MNAPAPDEMLHSPMPPTRRFVAPALRWAFLAALLVTGIGGLLVAVAALATGATPDLAGFGRGALAWYVGLMPLLFVGRLFALSRAFADWAFAWIGFGATFFGLAMLVIFFGRLGYQAVCWFEEIPPRVERQNAHLEERLANIEASIDRQMAAVRQEMADEIALKPEDEKAIRQFFEQVLIPAKRAALDLTTDEFRRERDAGVRPSTSAFALLWHFLTNGPTHVPQDAGIWPALLGSLMLTLITLVFAVPVGVGAALYLEEYRTNNRLNRLIQININNLAGVPSVVYGILGGFVFFWFFSYLGRYDSRIAARNVLGGGLTLGLLTLPVVIVAAQEAIRAVPPSIRMGAYALGATKWQTIWRQVLPLAWPGILTGTILSLSRAIGEAAPLILFGALLFVNETPSLFSGFTVLPMQIFGWSDRPEEIWLLNAAMGCIVLMVTLLCMNAVAIWMRNRAQKRLKW